METVAYAGWKHNVRLANGEMELIVTQDVGPRIIRFGFIGGPNLFGEIRGQLGKNGEREWQIRGGHRLWVAPESKKRSCEPDNRPISIRDIPGGIQTFQKAGPLGIEKSMKITLAPRGTAVKITHTLTNRNRTPFDLSVWSLTVMPRRGVAIIPLPAKISHTKRLTHNQNWSLWGYTDFSDPRWTLGSRYLQFRQDPARSANKLGIAQREGWAAYWLDKTLFVKKFKRIEGAAYPDGDVNFETFANEDILELESLGPMVTLKPGGSAQHEEIWTAFRNVPNCRTEADLDRHVRARARKV